MTSVSLQNNVTTRSKARRQRMSIAQVLNDDDSDEPTPPRQCASYIKRINKQAPKSIAERSQNVNYTNAQRLQALTLYEYSIAANIVATTAGVKDARTIKRWLRKAQEQGYDRTKSTIMDIKYVQDDCRVSRPIRCDPVEQAAIVAMGKRYLKLLIMLFNSC